VLPGEILDSTDPRLKERVLKEVHDDGLRWMNGSNNARRGEKMLIWSDLRRRQLSLHPRIRLPPTTVSSPAASAPRRITSSAKQKDGRDVHLHVGCWRFDPELSEAALQSLGNGAPGG